ncbi:MAG: sugar transferase [Anaerolineales bacterium]|nr:sugar transferase [Anaerolineales bacterium]
MENSYVSRIHFRTEKQSPFVVWMDRFLRRTIDILVSFFGIMFLSPVLGFVAILIRMDSPGPTFYRGPRLGRGGKPFGILKFRTMYADPASFAGARVTAAGDSRITPFGKWLRDTKVNELPQLWNVLIGEMSLVGPRPEDPELAADWPEDVKTELLAVRPGITSPASVFYRDEEQMLVGDNVMQDYLYTILPSKLRLDLMYLRGRTILTDMDVILWTALVLLPQLRKQSVPQHLLMWGPLSRFVTNHFNWFLVDFFVVMLCYGGAATLWRLTRPLNIGFSTAFLTVLAISALFSLINGLLGVNRIGWSKAPANSAMDLLASAAFATVVVLAVDRILFPPETMPFNLMVTGSLLSAVGFIVVRYRERLITGVASRWLGSRVALQRVGERVLVVGGGDLGEFVVWLFKRGDFAKAFSVVGVVDDDPRKVGMAVDRSPILGTSENLPELIKKFDIGVIAFAISKIDEADRERIIEVCSQTKARLILFPNVLENLQTFVKSDHRLINQDMQTRKKRLHGEALDAWYDELNSLIAEGKTLRAQELLKEIREQFRPPEV